MVLIQCKIFDPSNCQVSRQNPQSVMVRETQTGSLKEKLESFGNGEEGKGEEERATNGFSVIALQKMSAEEKEI